MHRRPADFFARVICARRAAEALRSLGHAGEASGVLSRASRRGMPDGLSEWLGSQPPSAVVELLLGAVEGGVGEVYKACWDRIGEVRMAWGAALTGLVHLSVASPWRYTLTALTLLAMSFCGCQEGWLDHRVPRILSQADLDSSTVHRRVVAPPPAYWWPVVP